MKRGIKIVLWVVGIVVVLLAGVSLVAGSIAKSYIGKHGKEMTGRRVEVQHVGVNLLTGHLAVRGLALYEEDESTLFAGFDTLDVGLRLLALPFRTVHVSHATLAGLHAHLLQQGEQFNFSSLLDHFASDDSNTAPAPSHWKVRLRRIRLSHASLDYRDLLSGKAVSLPDINLRVPGFTVGGNEQSDGGVSIGFAEGGTLSVDAHYMAQLHRYTLEAELSRFSLKNIEPILPASLGIEKLRGQLQAKVQAQGEVRSLLSSSIGGEALIVDLDAHNEHGKWVSMDSLQVVLNNANLERNSYDVASLIVSRFALKMHHYATDTMASDAAQPAPNTAKSNPIDLSIGDLQLRECAFTYVDHTLPDRFDFPVTGIQLASTNLSTRGINNATLQASLPGGGRLSMRWQGVIDQWKQFQEVKVALSGFPIKKINPLVVDYTGRSFTDGILGLNSTLRIAHSALSNDNHIDLYKPSVGKRHKEVSPKANIPLKTALYVLKDKDDRIIIDLPVSGNIDSPEFSYMKVVWKTLGQLLVKVATSPVRAIAGVLGSDSDDLTFIPIDPTQEALTSEQYHTLSRLAMLAQEDKLLVLKLQHPVPSVADSALWSQTDAQVAAYLYEQGVRKKQLIISTTDSTEATPRTGYRIDSELLIEE